MNSSIPGTYTYVFSATDQAGNAAVPVTRTVIVNDTTPPVISLIGANPLYIDQNSPSFVDPGVTATDNVDGDLTTAVNTSGFVDTTTAGSYVITYDVQELQHYPLDRLRKTHKCTFQGSWTSHCFLLLKLH